MQLLRSYSFAPKELNQAFICYVYKQVEALTPYFIRFNSRSAVDEAKQRTVRNIIENYNPAAGSLKAYIKVNARKVMLEKLKDVPTEMVEVMSVDNGGRVNRNNHPNKYLTDITKEYIGGNKPLVWGFTEDFSDEICNQFVPEYDIEDAVIDLALSFMDKFVFMCDALLRRDTSTAGYSSKFISYAITLYRRNKNFVKASLYIYDLYKEDFDWFLSLKDSDEWIESNYQIIDKNKSKRVKLVTPATAIAVDDADVESWELSGSIADKRLITVYYNDLWETLCDKVDSFETNELKFIINDSYIIRTLGGSWSCSNVDCNNVYDNIRMEILTNVLRFLPNGRILNIGREKFYFLCDRLSAVNCIDMDIKGIHVHLDFEDITDTL